MYQMTYNSLINVLALDNVKNNPSEQWKAFYDMRKMFHLLNRESHLPEEWNVPPSVAERLFGERPPGITEAPYEDDDNASAVSYISSSEEESEIDETEGIDALEARMRKEYSSLSRGKVLYWWPLGTGTQIFVRYGSKHKPIYRVRAGSSIPYDPLTAEQILSKTRGTAKVTLKSGQHKVEQWEYSRDEVQDIIGVGWKVEDDDDASANALALIRPVKDATYPHTRVLVKWKDQNVSLERRAFVRRITHGNGLNGDRLIYLKAKELENAYWGYDVEGSSDEESDTSDVSSADESLDRQTRSRRARKYPRRVRSARKKTRLTESNATSDSDLDSDTSESGYEQKKRRSKRLRHKRTKPKDEYDTDAEIRDLQGKLERIKLKKTRKKSASSHKARRRRT
ncbi:hypothetical protein BJX63DRAFT_416658 [Aspergillus granulosus]|uniref:Uncharacterized protein n=1 Tax=Aspergillus granulosus TaxID=176169 RepID=A0ABR4GRR2_9EURO